MRSRLRRTYARCHERDPGSGLTVRGRPAMTQWGLDTLFNPAKRHMDEEKRRLQATRQQVGDTSGGKRIDLESGKVRIGKKADGEPDTDDAADTDDGPESQYTADSDHASDPDQAPAARATGEAVTDASPEPSAKKGRRGRAAPEKSLTPAQVRAAERRRRTAH